MERKAEEPGARELELMRKAYRRQWYKSLVLCGVMAFWLLSLVFSSVTGGPLMALRLPLLVLVELFDMEGLLVYAVVLFALMAATLWTQATLACPVCGHNRGMHAKETIGVMTSCPHCGFDPKGGTGKWRRGWADENPLPPEVVVEEVRRMERRSLILTGLGLAFLIGGCLLARWLGKNVELSAGADRALMGLFSVSVVLPFTIAELQWRCPQCDARLRPVLCKAPRTCACCLVNLKTGKRPQGGKMEK